MPYSDCHETNYVGVFRISWIVKIKKIVPIPNYDVMKAHRRSGDEVPCILNLGMRWRLAVRFMLLSLYSQKMNLWWSDHWKWCWMDPRASLDVVVKTKFLPLLEIEYDRIWSCTLYSAILLLCSEKRIWKPHFYN